jgi:uncharacterized protein with PIN domain
VTNCINADYFEGPEFSAMTTRRAAKDHECCECGDAIQKGDLHEYYRGVWEGTWQSFRTCARCTNVATDFFHGRVFTMMVEDFNDAHGFDYRDGIPADFTPCGQTQERAS